MPYFHFEEIFTPLRFIGFRFYRDQDEGVWIKIGSGHRRRIRKGILHG